jgi:hypothetical protein
LQRVELSRGQLLFCIQVRLFCFGGQAQGVEGSSRYDKFNRK